MSALLRQRAIFLCGLAGTARARINRAPFRISLWRGNHSTVLSTQAAAMARRTGHVRFGLDVAKGGHAGRKPGDDEISSRTANYPACQVYEHGDTPTRALLANLYPPQRRVANMMLDD